MSTGAAHSPQTTQTARGFVAVCSCGWTSEPAAYGVTADGDGLRHWLENPEQEDTTMESTTRRSDAEFDELTSAAYELGAEHGRNAAGWYFDGNTSESTYRRVLEQLEDGDPAIYDTFPSAPLSGEWADGLTPAGLLELLGLEPDDEDEDELCRMYEDGYGVAVADEIERAARAQLEDGGN